jgi:hypothetical protein
MSASAVPRTADANRPDGRRTERRLDGGYREYARWRRPAPHAALPTATSKSWQLGIAHLPPWRAGRFLSPAVRKVRRCVGLVHLAHASQLMAERLVVLRNARFRWLPAARRHRRPSLDRPACCAYGRTDAPAQAHHSSELTVRAALSRADAMRVLWSPTKAAQLEAMEVLGRITADVSRSGGACLVSTSNADLPKPLCAAAWRGWTALHRRSVHAPARREPPASPACSRARRSAAPGCP